MQKMNVKWLTGSGWLTGRVIGEFELGHEAFYRVLCMFGEVRAMRNEDLEVTF